MSTGNRRIRREDEAAEVLGGERPRGGRGALGACPLERRVSDNTVVRVGKGARTSARSESRGRERARAGVSPLSCHFARTG